MKAMPPGGSAPASKLELAGRMLDLEAGNLIDVDGAIIGLRPQAWALLCVLARHAGSIVTKADLLDAVWPGLVVTDSSLAKAISDLRAAFGSDGHAVIKTAARRGYRLMGSEASPTAARVPPRTVLPAERGPLFGRGEELAALLPMLARHRLVTITGAGGVGKTALAMAAARGHVAEAGLAAAWVDLAQLADPNLLIATVARALGLPVAQGDEQLAGLLAAVEPLKTLLVLDNAEHLVAGVSRLSRAMLDAAPGLQLLVTSQAPLRLEGEQVFRLAGLEVPAAGESIAEASRRGAVALLIHQVRATDRSFEMTPANANLVIELCRRLDGLPLAIRLAAGRLTLIGLPGVVARLDERLQLLAGEGRDTPSRQQTLTAALDWSYGLLQVEEQALFRCLGMFVGGFSLELAVALARCEQIDEWVLIERLNVLVERNLVDVDHAAEPRYRMLESQRDYAAQLLRKSGEMERVRGHHAKAVESVMRIASKQIWVTTDAVWHARWAAELDNVRAALDWTAGNDASLFASLVGSTGNLFRMLDLAYELRRRASAVSPEILAKVDTELQMRYWMSRNYLEAGMSSQAAHDSAWRMEQAARSIGHAPALYLALCHRVSSGRMAPAELPATLAEIEALESPDWPARNLAYRSMAEYVANGVLNKWPQAQQAAEAGLERAIEAGSALMQGTFANGIVVALLGQHDVRSAIERSQALRGFVLPGPTGSAVPFIGTCARCAMEAGDLASARQQFAQLFDMCRIVEWMYFDHFASLYLRLAMTESRFEAAAHLLGYADAAAKRSWDTKHAADAREATRSMLAEKLAPARLARLLDEGARSDREGVCAWVLGES